MRRPKVFAALALSAAALWTMAMPVSADTFRWMGSSGSYYWEGRNMNCGESGTTGSSWARAHTAWTNAPSNGYMKVSFARQVYDDSNTWKTLSTQTAELKDTSYEGYRGTIHFSRRFTPSYTTGGYAIRFKITIQWKKDDALRDTVARTQTIYTAYCYQRDY